MADRAAETLVTTPHQLLNSGEQSACLVHIYPTGTNIGRRYSLGNSPILLGRGEDNDIRIQDNSVSRKHARVIPLEDGYQVTDLGSTNGTFLDDRAISHAETLRDGCYLRVGNCIFKFLTGGSIEADYHEEIYRLTIMDGLTDIYNHRYMMDFLDRELARSIRHDRPLSLMLIDIDRFKTINDSHGHLCGDFVLRELSHRIKNSIRREDLFARYGGEEFAHVLVETDPAETVAAAERIRESVSVRPFRFDTHCMNLTVSIGVAWTPGGETGLTPQLLIQRADGKLYEAKSSGRNRVSS